MPGYGVTFISRSSVESDLAAGTLAEARVEGLELKREIYLVRASGRVESRAAQGVRRLRARPAAVIVRWSLGELPGVLAELGIAQPFLVASRRWDSVVDAPARRPVGGGSVRSDRGHAAAQTGSSRSAAARRSTPPRRPRRRPGCRSSRCRRRTRARSGRRATAFARHDRRMVGGGGGAHLAGDRLRRRPHARPAACGDRRHGAERARALRRGALRRAAPTRATGVRSRAPS